MKITKDDPFARDENGNPIENTMDLDITQEQLDAWENKGVLIQDAMPDLKPEEREFLISGITPEKWNELFGETEDFDLSEWNEDGSFKTEAFHKGLKNPFKEENPLNHLWYALKEHCNTPPAHTHLLVGRAIIDLMQKADTYLTGNKAYEVDSGNYRSLEYGVQKLLNGDVIQWYLSDGGYSRISMDISEPEEFHFELNQHDSLTKVKENWALALENK